MIVIYTGKPGTGKSLKLADMICGLLVRNKKWFLKTGQVRKIATNLGLSEDVEKEYSMFLDFARVGQSRLTPNWSEPEQLIEMRDVDIIWDEIAVHLDSMQYQNVPLALKKFLQQHRKRGIDIYGTTQAFPMIDISMRRLVDHVWVCYKVLGSPNPSPTRPPIQRIYGLIWLVDVDPMTFEDEKPKNNGFDWLFITRSLVDVYDTKQEILMGKYPPLHHVLRECSDPNCSYHRVLHF